LGEDSGSSPTRRRSDFLTGALDPSSFYRQALLELPAVAAKPVATPASVFDHMSSKKCAELRALVEKMTECREV